MKEVDIGHLEELVLVLVERGPVDETDEDSDRGGHVLREYVLREYMF